MLLPWWVVSKPEVAFRMWRLKLLCVSYLLSFSLWVGFLSFSIELILWYIFLLSSSGDDKSKNLHIKSFFKHMKAFFLLLFQIKKYRERYTLLCRGGGYSTWRLNFLIFWTWNFGLTPAIRGASLVHLWSSFCRTELAWHLYTTHTWWHYSK